MITRRHVLSIFKRRILVFFCPVLQRKDRAIQRTNTTKTYWVIKWIALFTPRTTGACSQKFISSWLAHFAFTIWLISHGQNWDFTLDPRQKSTLLGSFHDQFRRVSCCVWELALQGWSVLFCFWLCVKVGPRYILGTQWSYGKLAIGTLNGREGTGSIPLSVTWACHVGDLLRACYLFLVFF